MNCRPVEGAPKPKRGIAGSEDADPSEAGTLSNALKNAVDDQNSQKGNTANPDAADDGGLGEEQDHEVEPQEEGGEVILYLESKKKKKKKKRKKESEIRKKRAFPHFFLFNRKLSFEFPFPYIRN